MTVLVGGVGELYQGDLDLGRRVVERLGSEDLGPHVAVEELHYGAVAVAQHLDELRPTTLVLVGAAERGRPPATVERRRVRPEELALSPEELQGAVGDAVTGYVTIGLLLEVGHGFGVLPPRVVTVEVEPVCCGPSERLSSEVAEVMDEVLALVRAEARRAPLLDLAGRLRSVVGDGHLHRSPAVAELEALLAELERLDHDGRWGATFAWRDRLRRRLGRGDVGEGMDHLDWGLWWALVEELDRLQPLESGP